MSHVTRTQTQHPPYGRDLGFFGNLFVRHIHFDHAGDVMDGHSHQFDHVTLLSRGAVTVRCLPDTQGRDYTAPAFIQLPARLVHQFTARQDETECWCIFAVRDLAGEVLDHPDSTSQPVIGF